MWAPNRSTSIRTQRTPSVHSIGSAHSAGRSQSITMSPVSRQSDPEPFQFPKVAPPAEKPTDKIPAIWQEQQKQAAPTLKKFVEPPVAVIHHREPATPHAKPEDRPAWNEAPFDDTTSRSSTLDGEEEYMEPPEKKSAVTRHAPTHMPREEPRSPLPAPHVPGPLESQLAALMSKLIYIEQANPTISVDPEEFAEMKARLKALEEEKKTWWKRHEAIWALRDEDVENNIKIRGLLAKERREHEATKALREEDLANVQAVRSKLAEKTRELERFQAQSGRTSPSRGRPGSFFERRDTSDLFTAAKTAALEQRALELEKRNSDLVAQVETLKGGANIDDLNRLTAHQAWKDTVRDLETRVKIKDAELARLRQGQPSSGNGLDWYRIEALLEEHAGYRESVGGKLQALRSEKEALQRDLHRKENDCHVLELKVQSLQRRSTVYSI